MKLYTSYLNGCYQHIFQQTIINSWGYLYFDLNGRYLQLMSDKNLLDLFLKNDLYIDQIIDVSNNKNNYFSSDVLTDQFTSDKVRQILIDNKYSYFFDIINRQPDFIEIYTFATSVDPHQAGNFSLNNIDILKLISQDLGARCRKLLTKENVLLLPKDFIIQINGIFQLQKDTKPSGLLDIILETTQASSKLKESVNDKSFDFNLLPFNFVAYKELTHKEKEMIYLYYFGFNFYRIADILEISKRTVDKHFENIKKKLNCESTGQIIPQLLRTNITINDFIKKC
ncbi:helix-turn-helix transcriptional regulator [Legionella cardiaca]|uniref:Helix-turn-helix transcriptional regulator n=1 Tax=Legionella cardiaca TaxID=1071983 RepID=A0ABY8ASS0_9GAMM|nr:helix-turn-helix transcriptional regulator [Legionella cardiaca]WED42222.1 helix-turn-helix transcriptional regulator [Legionella cardiaca]